ncbi:hypothetical protein [Streptomyces sp. NBC_00207]|uniref:hypothetical protein n=1 Tax=unclassified Streptomyces TaxID=2593676 RepID=UPI00386D4968
MALTECGTHVPVDAAFDAVAKLSEHRLARRLLAALQPDMLLADRNFSGYELCGLARANGAHLTWRIKKNLVFVALRVLLGHADPEGSRPAWTGQGPGRSLAEPPQGHTVRIIQDTVTVRPLVGLPHTKTFRLVTSLLNRRLAPARQPENDLPPAVGDRKRIRRTEEPPAWGRVHPALQGTRADLPGDPRLHHRLPGAVRTGDSRRRTGRDRSRPGPPAPVATHLFTHLAQVKCGRTANKPRSAWSFEVSSQSQVCRKIRNGCRSGDRRSHTEAVGHLAEYFKTFMRIYVGVTIKDRNHGQKGLIAMASGELEEEQVIVHVPRGQAENVEVRETDEEDVSAEITVQVSRRRKRRDIPVLGVIVK